MMPEVVFVSLRRRRKYKPPETVLGWILEILGFVFVIASVLINNKNAPSGSLRKVSSSALMIIGLILMICSSVADMLLKK